MSLANRPLSILTSVLLSPFPHSILFIIIGVLVANFIVDIVYVIVDPRVRVSMTGGTA